MDNSDDGEGLVMEEDEEEETNETEEVMTIITEDAKKKEGDDTNKTGDYMKPEESEGDNAMDDPKKTGDNMKPEEKEGDNAMDDTNKTGEDMKPEEKERDNAVDGTKETEATETVHEELTQEMPEMVHKLDKECTEAETENLVESKETSPHNQVAACDLVS